MTVYILIVSNSDNILGVYDSELLALKRKAYYDGADYGYDEIKIVKKYMEYMHRE